MFRNLVCASLLVLAAVNVSAQTYPEKPVRLVVPYTPGGLTDTLGRVISAELSKKWGKSVVVENRPGGGSSIGASQVASSAPDGYTILEGSVGMVTNPHLMGKLPYDPKALVPVALVGVAPLVIVVNPELPIKTLSDLVEFAKKTPGGITFASSGNGSSPHITAELFSAEAGIPIIHIPYRGTAPALQDLIGGQVMAAFDTRLTLPHLESGRLRAIAVASETRLPALPDLPTIAEAGGPKLSAKSWFGFFVPAGTPDDIRQKIANDILEVARQPEVQIKISELGLEPETMDTATFEKFLIAESEKWGGVIRDQKITIN